MEHLKNERYNYKYLVNLGLYDDQERIIDFKKNLDDLTTEEISFVRYMYCRDLESGDSVYFMGKEIEDALFFYNNRLLRKTNGGGVVPREYRRLEEIYHDSKDLPELECTDNLWAGISKLQKVEDSKKLKLIWKR